MTAELKLLLQKIAEYRTAAVRICNKEKAEIEQLLDKG
jgi:hypothetical protein